MTDPVPDLADVIAVPAEAPAARLRVGVVIAVETSGTRRIQTDLSGDAWLNKTTEVEASVGDRVAVLQQGAVMLVVGRLSGGSGGMPVGAVIPYAGASAPPGWLLANGVAVSRVTYAALFARIGTAYGAGDGSTTFNLPDLRDRFPVGTGYSYTPGSVGGANSVTLTVDQLPPHQHPTISNSYFYEVALAGGGSAEVVQRNTNAMTGYTGGGDPHENRPPYLGLTFIIRAL